MDTIGESIDVLHVDDEPDFAEMAATFVERVDDRIEVEIATSASKGLDRLADEDIDCVVSDYDMPGQDGIQFLEAVRQEHPDLPFILYTGKGSEEVASDAISAGVTDYLQKGTGTSQYTVLANRIRNSVEKNHFRTALADREKRLNLLFEQSSIGVIEWTENFEFHRLNDAAEDILGYSESELTGRSWEVIVPEPDRDEFEDVVSELLENKGGFHSINENVRKDGDRIICEWHNRVVTDPDGDVAAIFSQFIDITERRRRKRQLNTLIDNVPGIVYRCENERGWPMDQVRGGVRDLTGYSAEEIKSEETFYGKRIVHPEDREAVWDEIQDAVAAGEVFELTYRIRTKDETIKWVWERGRPVDSTDGETGILEGFITDITERVRREERLDQQRSLFEALLKTSIDGILVVNEDREYVTWNQQFIDMWGVPEELVGDEPEDLGLEWVLDQLENPDEFLDNVEYLYEHPTEESRDEIQLTDGRVFDRYSAPVEGEDGTYYGRVWFFRDITNLKGHERALTEERDKYQALIEGSNDGIVIYQGGSFVFVNERCLDILGYERDEFIGMEFSDIVVPEDQDLVQRHYEQRICGDDESIPDQYEVQVLTKDGERRVSEVSAARIHYEDEPADLITIRDVTERSRQEEKLANVTKELEILNRVLRHDIRNDLAVMLGWAASLEGQVGECEQESLDKIITSGEHIVELTEIARDYVNTLTGDEELAVKPTSLRRIIENELDLRRASYPDATFTLESEVPTVEVMANEMLESVFRNLLNNAVQHNDKDEPRVTMSFEIDEETVVVRVADNGPGIAPGRKESIFGKGEKGLESSSTGIGLYLVRTLVDEYGGSVWVEDNDPEGTVCHVQLTRAE